jgi:predicted DsbA family dithiol-disulfide isomerase
MTLSIKVYSDCVCPFCYLAKTPLENAVKGKDVGVEWFPFELRPSPTPAIDPWNNPGKVRTWETVLVPTAEKWGVQMKLPRMSPHPYTGLAFEGYQFAKAHGKGSAYHDYW